MDKLIAYGVLAFALYKIFVDDKPKVQSEQPKIEDAKGEPTMNMSGFAYMTQSKPNDVNGLYFEGNMNFFD